MMGEEKSKVGKWGEKKTHYQIDKKKKKNPSNKN